MSVLYLYDGSRSHDDRTYFWKRNKYCFKHFMKGFVIFYENCSFDNKFYLSVSSIYLVHSWTTIIGWKWQDFFAKFQLFNKCSHLLNFS